MQDYIDEVAEALQKSQKYNFAIWKNELNYNEQIAMLKVWLGKRIAYMDRELNNW